MGKEGKVIKTFVYPIKGMHGVETPTRGLYAHTRLGVIGDRTFAIFRKAKGLPTEWKPKGQFHICMNREGMATPHHLTEADLDERFRPDPEFVTGLLMGHGAFLNEEDDLPLVDTGGEWHICDDHKPYVSFLNLASVRDLEGALNISIDPRRFRMNVWVDGLDPWVELDYVTGFDQPEHYPMRAHGVYLGIDDLCERCRAVEQSPVTGKWDLDLQELIAGHLQNRGYAGSPHRNVHRVMGWLAIPQNDGPIREGCSVVLGCG